MKGYLSRCRWSADLLDVQPEEVWAFWRFMRTTSARASSTSGARSRCSSSRAASKRSASVSKDRFLKNFTTTIGPAHPHAVRGRLAQGGWDLWHQVVICVHEHQHVVQHDRRAGLRSSYLADRARAPAGRPRPTARTSSCSSGAHGHDALGQRTARC